MKKYILLALVFGQISIARAQINGAGGLATDVNGRVLRPSKMTFEDGSPYLNNSFMKAVVNSNGDKLFTFEKARFNLMESQLEHEFNGQTYAITDEIKEFQIESKDEEGRLVTKKFRRNFADYEAFNAKTFYELLFDGKVKLLMKTSVRMSAHPKALSTQIEQSYFQNDSYFIVDKTGKLTLFVKGKTDVIALISSQKEQLTAFVKKEKLSLKMPTDIAILMAYADSL